MGSYIRKTKKLTPIVSGMAQPFESPDLLALLKVLTDTFKYEREISTYPGNQMLKRKQMILKDI